MGLIFANALFLSKEWKWNKNLRKMKTFQVGKYTKVCSNNFEYGRPVEAAPNPTLFSRVMTMMPTLVLKRKLQLQEKSRQLERK